MKLKKILSLLTASFMLTSALAFSVACGGNNGEPSVNDYTPEEVSSQSLYVKKVADLPDDFIMGMDLSSVLSLEASGVKFYGFDGKEEDIFKTLADSGVTTIRVRVWNDPFDDKGNGYGGGNCDINTAVEIGKRANKYGMSLLVDFHYSDFWADPAKQMVPKAWQGMEIKEKAEALYNYTKDCMNKLKKAGVAVSMVQIGNETNGAMCGEKNNWMNIVYHLMASGSKAVRETYSNALIAVHFANPEKVSNYKDYAKKLAYYELDYDVFGSSYYPYWHGTLDNLTSLLSEIAETYDKKVMVLETSYAYTSKDTDFFGNTISDGGSVTKTQPYTVQGQANAITNVIEAVSKMKNGIGVCYWEGAWITVGQNSYEENLAKWEKYGSGWASSYSAQYDPGDAGKYYGGSAVDNQAFFDKDGKPLESLKVFSLVRTGNTVPLRADAIEDTNLIFDLNGEIVLPSKVNAVMNDASKQEIDVEWHNVDIDAMKKGGVKKYDIVGTAGGMEAHCYVSMVEYNFLENYSFEDDTEKVPKGWTVNEIKKNDGSYKSELFVENKATDSLTGTNHFHFWSEKVNTVEFELEQEIKNLPAGTYKYSISIMGGDCGETDIYAYVKINDEIVKTAPLTIKGYGNWDTAWINNIVYNGTDKIVVGIYVKCAGENAGAWGKIDDALFNSVAQ